ncbi:hypothetical protein [Hyphobacterium marinum]|uniref:TonB C-terminal domain-containing protein n=1 Tax=Hyphobacterium marinum TaxID=3116574 RepID=A0ABU7M1E5_9PROT|nr:hypothetical protein [Hyphobacterium sp. Y6023]MEE2567638.1 hypothetical protein [Hyphobacterium sp. Y6023]
MKSLSALLLGLVLLTGPAAAQLTDMEPDDRAAMAAAVDAAEAGERAGLPPAEQAQLWLDAANTALNGRELVGTAGRRAAQRHVERAERILDRAGIDAPLMRGRIALAHANYWRWRERFERARDFADDGIALLETGGADRRELADAYYAAGFITYRALDVPGAGRRFRAALDLYQELLPVLHHRRLRTNGWTTMTEALAERIAAADRQLFVMVANAPPADTELGERHGGDWAVTEAPGFDTTAWHGRLDGFAVILLDVDAQGVPTNIRLEETYPGDLWDREILHGLTAWRLDPDALADPDARTTDIALTFIYGVQRYHR